MKYIKELLKCRFKKGFSYITITCENKEHYDRIVKRFKKKRYTQIF